MRDTDRMETESMGPRPGYKQPGREGQKAVAFWLDEDVRAAFKIAATENGTTMQDAFEQWVLEYAAGPLKRMKRKGALSP
ncbi:MAG TPA: hypothetical protein PKE16_14960 [Hyphomicrobium sp.]|nr:hypothetical protein [Hyphomicrobium sp.]